MLRLATFVISPSNVATGGYKKGTGRVTRPQIPVSPPIPHHGEILHPDHRHASRRAFRLRITRMR